MVFEAKGQATTMNRISSWHVGGALGMALTVALLLTPQPAAACGGCVAPVDSPFAVNGHRMAIKVSDSETILWDQFSWAGDPADFAWILPLPAVGVVELAENGFFEALEDQTAPLIYGPLPPPPVFCDDADGPFFGSSASDASTFASDSGVTVYYEGVVGPYETVTIGATNPDELYTWLIANDYAIPEDTLPVLQWYVDVGSVFVALRLAPEFGINQMQPVRVRYPVPAISFPLKMVAVGAAAELDLTLFVISDRRYTSLNYPASPIPTESLVWDSNIGRSNYNELYDQVVDNDGGRGWAVEYAMPTLDLPLPYDWEEDVYLGAEDWDVARAGSEGTTWVTRLRTTISPAALDEDLFLEPAWETGIVDNVHNVTVDINPPPPPAPCPVGKPMGPGGPGAGWFVGGGCAITSLTSSRAPLALLGLMGLALCGMTVARRRRRS